MQKLIQVLERYYLVLLFLILELIGFLLLVRYNTYHQISYLSWVNEVTGGVYQRVSRVTEHMQLMEDNQALAAENAILRNKLTNAYLMVDHDFNPWVDTNYQQSYVFREGKVIANELHKPNNFLMLNRGKLSGIRKGMGVINGDGIVGVVTDVSKHYSVVMSVLNQDFQIGVRLKANDYFGILQWDAEDPHYAILSNIQSFVPVQKGDTVETMEASQMYPEGILVGTIDEFTADEETQTWVIKVKLSADLQKAKHVYILENLFEEEVVTLTEEQE